MPRNKYDVVQAIMGRTVGRTFLNRAFVSAYENAVNMTIDLYSISFQHSFLSLVPIYIRSETRKNPIPSFLLFLGIIFQNIMQLVFFIFCNTFKNNFSCILK